MSTSKIIAKIIENYSEFSECANNCNKFVSSRSWLRFFISRFLRRKKTGKNLNSIPGSREKNGKNNIMCKWQYKQNQTGNNTCKFSIHFFCNSFAENWGHWLIGHSAANEFWWQTSPQRRKLIPYQPGADPGGIGAIALPPKTYESNFIHNDFVQFRKKHSRYKAIFPSTVLSQQCCDVYFTSPYSSEPVNETWLPNITEIAHLNLLAGSAPVLNWGWWNAQLWFACSVMLVMITTHVQSARHLRSNY